MLHYLDDYFTLGPAGRLTSDSSIRAIQEASRDLEVPLASEKCEDSTTCLIFLGIELDSTNMTVRLPIDKLSELQALISDWVDRKFCTCEQLESSVGKLKS